MQRKKKECEIEVAERTIVTTRVFQKF